MMYRMPHMTNDYANNLYRNEGLRHIRHTEQIHRRSQTVVKLGQARVVIGV
jgi:hypothetical protein